MDDTVRNIIGKVKEAATVAGQAAGRAAEEAGKKAGEMMEVTRLNLRIIDLENEVSKLLGEIGAVIYEAHVSPDLEPAGIDEKLIAIDERKSEISEAKERIEACKKSRKCQNPECGCTCSKEDRFCAACGSPLE